MYQDDPRFGEDAVLSRISWTVASPTQPTLVVSPAANGRIGITFVAAPNLTYFLYRKFTVDAPGPWDAAENFVTVVPPVDVETIINLEPPTDAGQSFYRVLAVEFPRQP